MPDIEYTNGRYIQERYSNYESKKSKVELIPGVWLYGLAANNKLWLCYHEFYDYSQYHSSEVENLFTIDVDINSARYKFSGWTGNNSSYDSYYDQVGYVPYLYFNANVTFEGVTKTIEIRTMQPNCGNLSFNNEGCNVSIKVGALELERYYAFQKLSWKSFISVYKQSDMINQSKDDLLIAYFKHHTVDDHSGIRSVEYRKSISPNLVTLRTEEPVLAAFYEYLKHSKTVNKTSNNKLLRAMLLDVGHDAKLLKKELSTVLSDSIENPASSEYRCPDSRAMCLKFKAAQETERKRREKAEWNFRVGVREQAIGLGIDPIEHKLLMKAIESKKISLELFHAPKQPLELLNVEFDLWEKALKRKGWSDIIFEICDSITNRNMFSKHITPYLSFLFRIEKYLNRHTGRKWRAMPKIVNTTAQLELQESDETGTVKTRSALTPIADNHSDVITVPYAAIRMYGNKTTYCYSKLYQVFEQNTIDLVTQSVIDRDLEQKLNGRDDYGLMYYTLDGSAEAQGYPTFLIIMERRKDFTFVHFHRTHPCRKLNGHNTPASRLIQECYRYMAGNVRAEEITAQQGDLIFIKTEIPSNLNMDSGKFVNEFESHRFVPNPDKSPIKLFANEAKSIKNRLGFIFSMDDFTVEHPEHENVKLSAGYYEIRRCKSYENNPVAVWSYTFD